mmetsp:Transcript_25019/g.80870  ORF Transcript_25019/g.80870 Transcript_25019/m.80870 type:complete len:231 (+) Transcript_25019:2098-2790(+)
MVGRWRGGRRPMPPHSTLRWPPSPPAPSATCTSQRFPTRTNPSPRSSGPCRPFPSASPSSASRWSSRTAPATAPHTFLCWWQTTTCSTREKARSSKQRWRVPAATLSRSRSARSSPQAATTSMSKLAWHASSSRSPPSSPAPPAPASSARWPFTPPAATPSPTASSRSLRSAPGSSVHTISVIAATARPARRAECYSGARRAQKHSVRTACQLKQGWWAGRLGSRPEASR